MIIMSKKRPFARVIELLRAADIRPTRQRLALARLLFEKGHCHVTAEEVHEEALRVGIDVSLATVYNTLHQFTAAGLTREIMPDGARSYFDTNVSDHHHFFCEKDGRLVDIPADQVVVSDLPEPPEGTSIARIEVIVRLESDEKSL